MKVKLIKVKAKEIFTKTKLPGADWVINQYVGCEHACLYCYAKFISRWRPGSYGKWGSWVEAKVNAPELVKERRVAGWVYMSSISDPYQPVEKDLKLTRQILENLDKKTKLAIQTKSDLILRDIDLLKGFKNIQVGLTINDFKGEAKEVFEPFSPSNEKRINALRALKKEGIGTYAFVSPIIPGLINLRKVIRQTKKYTDSYWFEFINARGAGREFMDVLKKDFPESYNKLTDKKEFADSIKECKKIISLEKVKIQGIELH